MTHPSSSLSLLDVVATPLYDNLLTSFKYLQIQPLASTTYAHNDQIIFSLECMNDHFLPAQSFIMVEGEIMKKPATSDVKFVENGASRILRMRVPTKLCGN